VLGLIATNSVKIYHPVKRTCTSTKNGVCQAYSYTNLARPAGGSTFANPVVHASVLALQHSFTVQGYQYGSPLGYLHLYGALAQRYRGPVGTGTSDGSSVSGYLKDYEYDTRLRYAPPPFFLDPVRSSWGIKAFGETAPRFRP
jgi:hypothetical protein